MGLTLTKLRNVIIGRLGATVASQFDQDDIINEAGRTLVSIHPGGGWNFLLRPPALVDFPAPISISGATYTHATKRITKTAGFADYTFSPGDTWLQQSGTGDTEGTYTVASKVSDDAITLTTSIGAAADGQTDIAGTLPRPYATLPTDFGQLVSYEYGSLTGRFEFVDAAGLVRVLSQNIGAAGITYGHIVSPSQTSSAAALPNPRIQLAPAPTAAVVAALIIAYRAAWTELTFSSGSEIPNTPPWIDPLLRELVACVAQGYEEADNASFSARLAEIQRGPIFMQAVRYDGSRQPDYGTLVGGAVESGFPLGRLPFTSVAGP